MKLSYWSLIFCLIVSTALLYGLIEKQNKLIEMRMYLPKLEQEVRQIKETNLQLRYQVARFEDPKHLFKILNQAPYSHLKYPSNKEILTVK